MAPSILPITICATTRTKCASWGASHFVSNKYSDTTRLHQHSEISTGQTWSKY